MGDTSKDLLQLEHTSSSSSSIESKLRVCKSDSISISKSKRPVLDQKPVMAPLPPSQFLGKVKDFLGVMEEANKKLLLETQDYNIEELSGNESQYIEMDLMLGVADLHTPEAVAAAESAIAGNRPVIQLDNSDSDTESEDISEEDDDDDEGNPDFSGKSVILKPNEDKTSTALKDHSLKKRSKIVEISQDCLGSTMDESKD